MYVFSFTNICFSSFLQNLARVTGATYFSNICRIWCAKSVTRHSSWGIKIKPWTSSTISSSIWGIVSTYRNQRWQESKNIRRLLQGRGLLEQGLSCCWRQSRLSCRCSVPCHAYCSTPPMYLSYYEFGQRGKKSGFWSAYEVKEKLWASLPIHSAKKTIAMANRQDYQTVKQWSRRNRLMSTKRPTTATNTKHSEKL